MITKDDIDPQALEMATIAQQIIDCAARMSVVNLNDKSQRIQLSAKQKHLRLSGIQMLNHYAPLIIKDHPAKAVEEADPQPDPPLAPVKKKSPGHSKKKVQEVLAPTSDSSS
ncbi:MAG: hypothetical protein AB7V18_19635 [Pyrinomonadaceae bacterium]